MLAHVHIMKTAGQTVCDILRHSFGANHCDLRCGDLATKNEIKFARQFYPHLKSISGHSIRPWSDLSELDEVRFFTFLREPIARCLSHYQFDLVRNRKKVDFLDWLASRRNYQTRFIAGSEDPDQAIDILRSRIGFVGLLEEFDQSLELLQTWVGEPLALNYHSRNVASKRSVKDLVLSNPAFVRALRESHQADARLYSYVLNEVFPQQIKQLGSLRSFHASRNRFVTNRVWPALKRNAIYKPLAKIRERFKNAA